MLTASLTFNEGMTTQVHRMTPEEGIDLARVHTAICGSWDLRFQLLISTAFLHSTRQLIGTKAIAILYSLSDWCNGI